MGENKDSYKELLKHASDMGGMIYWRYFKKSGQLEVSDQIFGYLESNDSDLSDMDNKQACFERFINSVFVNEREGFRDIVFGRSLKPEGIYIYHIRLGNEIRYHKCKYSCVEEGDEEVIIGITQDITHIKKQEERNAKIIEAIPDFIFIFDSNFFIKDVLKSNEVELLHPIDYLIGVDGRDVYSPEVSRLFINSIHACLEDKEMKKIEYPLDADDGLRYYFQARMVPFDNDKVMALIHDVSERVRYTEELIQARKRAEKADKMKSTFLANMSHEIRTPLNAIVGFSEILLSCEDKEEKETYTDIIRKNSDLLLQLIDDILDLSRLESGKTEMHYQKVDMNLMMEEIARIYSMKMKPGVELRTEILENKVVTCTDRNRVTQVIFNFVSNAIKNTKEGSITLRMSLEEEFVRISVEDTGCGISEEHLPSIFQRFTKLNDFVQGTGLGLTICNNIVEKLGGRIEVSSVYGKGSNFTFVLPLTEDIEKESLINPLDSLLPESPTEEERKTILVAEDVDANFLLIKTILKKKYTLLWAMNGKEAVELFKKEKPDLILMDIKMPLMDGVEATKAIRLLSDSVPIIAITAHAFIAEKQAALDAGCNDVILKPYNHHVLKDTVKKYLFLKQ